MQCPGMNLLHMHLLKALWWYHPVPQWHSLQVQLLINTCLHVLLSIAHHIAQVHAGLLRLSAAHRHFSEVSVASLSITVWW